MAKPDEAHKRTDEALAQLERRISGIYGRAAKDMQEKIDAYFQFFAKRDGEQQEKLEAGEITEEYYKQWRLNQMGRGKRFQALRDQLAQRMTKANETAAAYMNDATPGIYSLNRNYAAYTIEQVAGDMGFTLWDEQTVKRLIVDQPDLMPYYPPARAVKRGIDLAYGKRQIIQQVTSGILQGEGIKQLADRLQQHIPDMNRKSAINAARTAVTGAQNAGRVESYEAAKQMGIKLKKEWRATLDGRTRHSHAMLDGEQVETDATFSNGCRFPGDPQGEPSEVYNCRCTLVASVDGVDTSDAQRRARDPVTGKREIVSNMTYAEWEKWVQKRAYSGIIDTKTSNGITIHSISAHTIDRASERGVSSANVVDAIQNPLHIGEIVLDRYGRKSQRFIGEKATVNVNPDTGNIATVWNTGKAQKKKYAKGDS